MAGDHMQHMVVTALDMQSLHTCTLRCSLQKQVSLVLDLAGQGWDWPRTLSGGFTNGKSCRLMSSKPTNCVLEVHVRSSGKLLQRPR